MDTGAEPTQPGPALVPAPVVAPVGEGALLDGRYRLHQLLGRGATAEVYQGIDELLSRAIAVKVFDTRLTDLNTVVRQRREMQILAAMSHRNLVAVYDAHIADDFPSIDGTVPPGPAGSGRTYLVMELVKGRTLAQQLTYGPMPPSEVATLGQTLGSVLAAVHRANLVHRDVKPANILLADTGDVKLGDFGIARILTAENRLTTSAAVMGTAAYFSPEQARGGNVGPPGDIYALGLVLLECLTGHREFPGDAVPAAVARLLRDPVIPTDLPLPWPPLLTAMTATDPRTRPTASQVTDTLASSLSTVGLPGSVAPRLGGHTAVLPLAELDTAWLSRPEPDRYASTQPHGGSPSQPTRAQRRRMLVLAGIGVVVAAAVGAAVITTQAGNPTFDHPGALLTTSTPTISGDKTIPTTPKATLQITPAAAAPATTTTPTTSRTRPGKGNGHSGDSGKGKGNGKGNGG